MSSSATNMSSNIAVDRNDDDDPLISGIFRSVLPHEPSSELIVAANQSIGDGDGATSSSSSSDPPPPPHHHQIASRKGYLHLQGAFEPKVKLELKKKKNDESMTLEGEEEEDQTPPFFWRDEEELESALFDVLNNRKSGSLGSLLPHPIERVHVVLPAASTPNVVAAKQNDHTKQEQEQQQQEKRQRQPLNKVRLQFRSMKQAMDFQTVWRKYKFSPSDLFEGGGGGGGDRRNRRATTIKGGERGDTYHQDLQHKTQLFNYCSITFGSHPCLATVVTPQPLPLLATSNADLDSDTTSKWTRSNPPKFRRLLHDHDDAKERSHTRFVYISGLLDVDSWNTYHHRCCSKTSNSGTDSDNDSLATSPPSSFLHRICRDNPQMMMDAIRHLLGSNGIEVFLPLPTSLNNSSKSVGKMKEEGLVEHSDSPSQITITPPPPFPFCHVGMSNAEDAQRIVRDFQGKIVDWNLPGVTESCDTNPDTLSLSSGPLFLDYVTISNKSKAKHKARRGGFDSSSNKNDVDWYERGEPSKPECTSTTDDIRVPGLVVIEDFVSEDQEEALMAVLMGPQAPWAPQQLNKSQTGAVKRKVQHYGYVFDYQTADVLRDRYQVQDEDTGRNYNFNQRHPDRRVNCPPLPILSLSDDDNKYESSPLIEKRINNAVQQGEGWKVLAGVIEKTRRHEFYIQGSNTSTDFPRVFDKINQLTVNQYKPGEGIGSHTDTISAFGDGLISISLNSGIVMEFRNPKVGPPTKKLVYLPRRSLLLMSGPARFEWEHQIVTRRTDTHKGEVLPRGLRVSLTLRTALDLDGTPLPRVTSTIFPPSFVEIEDGDIADNEVKSSSNALVTPDVEKDHVHRLYDAIATQWHHTRGKRGVLWPGATQFLQNLKPGSLVADVGCGDGKYFPAIWEAGSYVIGTDISRPLLLTALTSSKEDAKLPESRKISERSQSLQHRPAVAVGDCMSIPLRTNSCDAAICIAVMHHLSTLERRIRCIEELVRVVKPGGLINIQAWALEQKNNKNAKRRFASTDVFVPFNAQPKYLDTAVDRGSENIESHATAKTDERTSREQQPQLQGKSAAEIYSKKYRNAEFDDKKGLVVFQRYCHMYRAGELEDVVAMVPGATVVDSGYESGNHFVILEVMTDAAINRENRPT